MDATTMLVILALVGLASIVLGGWLTVRWWRSLRPGYVYVVYGRRHLDVIRELGGYLPWWRRLLAALRIRRHVLLYVGQTRHRDAAERIREHLYGSDHWGAPAQPWADLVTSWHTLPWWHRMPEALLDRREAVNIRWRRPLHNHTFNLDNPRRVPKSLAVAQREYRDMLRAQQYDLAA
jgi:hypothetical protein